MTLTDILRIVASATLSIGSGGAIVWALSSWLGRVWATRILEQDRAKYAREIEHLRAQYGRETEQLKTQLEKTVFVSRVHFETEFKALAEIWRNIADVRASISELRPIGPRMAQPDADEEAEFNKRFALYSKRFDELLKSVHYNSPFYSKDIHDQLVSLMKIANAEYVDLSVDGPRDQAWRKRGLQNRQEFMDGAEKVSDLIRERLHNLAVHVPHSAAEAV